MSAPLTKVEPSLHWHEAPLTSDRHRRLARKWPWSWRCTAAGCDEAYGAAKTQPEAQRAADEHERVAHRSLSETSLADPAQGQTPPIEGDRVT